LLELFNLIKDKYKYLYNIKTYKNANLGILFYIFLCYNLNEDKLWGIKMKDVILKYLVEHNCFVTEQELRKCLKVKKEEMVDEFVLSLNELIEEGLVFFDDKKGYRNFTNELGVAFGEIEINKKGNGFVHTNDGYTIFIESNYLNGSLHGDKVIVKSINFGRGNEFVGEIDKVIKRKTGNIICEVIGNGYKASILPYNSTELVPINIKKHEYKDLLDGQLIRVKVGTEKIDGEYSASIEDVVGHISDPGIDLKLIYLRNNIPVEFPKEVIDEANALPTEVLEEELIGRVDLRDKPIIAIDCDDTKDRDDAVYVEKFSNGNYKLYVNLSHISHYVKRESALYKEARLRCNSFYPNNTCNPMFPHTLSNGICSLNENVDRLTRTVEMEFDKDGKMVNYDIYPSVINTKKNMKYSEVNRVLDGEIVEGYAPYKEQLILMNELSNILERLKQERNYLDFDIPEIKPIIDITGKTNGLIETKQGKAEKIIENFMLIADTIAAEHYSWLPFIYRVHESPNEQTVKNVIKTLNLSGFKIPKYTNIDEYSIKELLEHVKTIEEANIIKTMILKSMKHARYDIEPIGHFALQEEKHTHFTAGIRRIADFENHLVADSVETMEYDNESINALEKELAIIASDASRMEKISQEIEREALAMAMAEYMEAHIGEEYNGTVTEVYQHGMFVKTENLVSGKVSFENMGNDVYQYDYDKRAIIGAKTKQKYQIGNKVYVMVKDASKANRTVDFQIVDKPKQKVLKKD